MPEVFTNRGSDNKGIIKPSGYFEFDNISESPCSFIYKISSEKANRMIACKRDLPGKFVWIIYTRKN